MGDNNLLFNNDRLQFIIFHSQRLIRKLGDNKKCGLFWSSTNLWNKRLNVKPLGAHFNQNITWNIHINIIKLTHGTLHGSSTLTRFTAFHVQKFLAEALLLSKTSYCNIIFTQLPTKYQITRLQKLHNAMVLCNCRCIRNQDMPKHT